MVPPKGVYLPLCAVCMLLCVAPSFAVLPGVLMYVSYMGELTV